MRRRPDAEVTAVFGDDCCLDRDLLAVGAFVARFEDAEHRVADGQIGAASSRGDGAGKIPPQDERKLGLRYRPRVPSNRRR